MSGRSAGLGALLGLAVLLSACSANRATLEISRGNTLFRKGEDSLAVLRYYRALDRPGDGRWEAWIRYNIGSSYVSLGELEPGIRVLDRVLALSAPGAALSGSGDRPGPRWRRELEFRVRFNRAVAAYELGDYAEAARGFAAALHVRPESWDAKVNLELSLAEEVARPAAPVQRPASPGPAEVPSDSQNILDQIQKKESPSWVSSQEQQVYAEDW